MSELALPAVTPDDAAPAHELRVELVTRISTQPLHYRSGDEETAAKSVYKLFDPTRALMKAHPKALAFGVVGLFLLNGILRSATARWHGWIVGERFKDERSRRRFRVELKHLQESLQTLQALLGCIVDKACTQADANRLFRQIVKACP